MTKSPIEKYYRVHVIFEIPFEKHYSDKLSETPIDVKEHLRNLESMISKKKLPILKDYAPFWLYQLLGIDSVIRENLRLPQILSKTEEMR